MTELEVGAEQFTDEDRFYAGSRFREVVDALFANPYPLPSLGTPGPKIYGSK